MKKALTLAVGLTAFCAITAQAADAGAAVAPPQPVVIQPTSALPAATPPSAVATSPAAPAAKTGKANKPAKKSNPKPKKKTAHK
jgi:hypothetical protein